jgi:hypothetical protein
MLGFGVRFKPALLLNDQAFKSSAGSGKMIQLRLAHFAAFYLRNESSEIAGRSR